MRKKRFAIVLTACLLISGTFTMNGTAYADTIEPVNKQAVAQTHAEHSGYRGSQLVKIPITGDDTGVRQLPSKRSGRPITGLCQDGTSRAGKAYLETLQEQQRKAALIVAYDALVNHIDTMDTSQIDLTTQSYACTEEDVKMLLELVRNDFPEFFWFDYKTKYYYNEQTKTASAIACEYSYTDEQKLRADKIAFDAVIKDLVSQAADMDTYDTELFFHNWIIKRCTYIDGKTHSHDAYGAIVEGEAVCEGYARALQILLNAAGIENHIVVGSSRNEGHAWNLVEVYPDAWFHVDTTWDDVGFSSWDEEDAITDDVISYAYFNCSDADISLDHIIGDVPGGNFVNYLPLPQSSTSAGWYYNVNHRHVANIAVYQAENNLHALADLIVELINDYGFARIYTSDDLQTEEDLNRFQNILDATDENCLMTLMLNKLYIEGQSVCGYQQISAREWNIYMQPSTGGTITKADVWDWFCQENAEQNMVIRAYAPETSLREIIPRIQLECGTGNKQDDKCLYEAAIEEVRRNGEAEDNLYYAAYLFKGIPLGTYQIAMYKPGCPVKLYEQTFEAGGKTLDRARKELPRCFTWLGDVDEDWKVNRGDVLLLKRHIAGWGGAYDNIDKFNGDINGNGALDASDVMHLERYLAEYKGYETLAAFYGSAA